MRASLLPAWTPPVQPVGRPALQVHFARRGRVYPPEARQDSCRRVAPGAARPAWGYRDRDRRRAEAEAWWSWRRARSRDRGDAEIGRGDGAMGFRVLLGIDEHVGEPVDGRDCGHGREGGAIVVGGALVVAAGLLVTRGQRKDGGIGCGSARAPGAARARPDFCRWRRGRRRWRLQSRPQRRPAWGWSCREPALPWRGLRAHKPPATALRTVRLLGKACDGGVENVDGALRVAVVHGRSGAAHAPVGPDILRRSRAARR